MGYKKTNKSLGYKLELGETTKVNGKTYIPYFVVNKEGVTVAEGAATGEGRRELRERLNRTLISRINNPFYVWMR